MTKAHELIQVKGSNGHVHNVEKRYGKVTAVSTSRVTKPK